MGKDQAYFLDSAKIRTVLSWADTISLEQEIEETIGWVRDNLEILRVKGDRLCPQTLNHLPEKR